MQNANSSTTNTNDLQVTTKYLNGLIELIHSNLQSNENASSLENPRKHFQRTLDYIASREYEGVVTAAK
jgi:vacuolar protein sorting-associated protein 35